MHQTASSLYWPPVTSTEGTTPAANDANRTGWHCLRQDELWNKLTLCKHQGLVTYKSKLSILPSNGK